MIIYFTGTGNSKYLAQVLAQKLCDTVEDATKLIKSEETPSFTSEKPYIFVSPVYAWKLPRVFEKWIGKCEFDGNKNAYFVLNCGDSIGAAGEYTQKLCADRGLDYMGTAEIVMPENYIAVFSAPEKAEENRIIDKATEEMAKLSEKISKQQSFDEVKITLIGRLCSGIVNSCFYTFTVSAKRFFVTDACISCGKCVENCMLNNISLENGKPVWGKACTHCMACICKCPTEAIEYSRHTKGLDRYVCPREK